MYRFVITFALAVMVALAGHALTKTPDGQTPSNEAACDGLTGAAFGTCTAYCEAQDCDVHERPSCARLRAKFQKQTGSEFFPCDRLPCGDAQFPECDGDCPAGLTCFAGAEAGGPEAGGPENGIATCACRVPCEGSEAPTCGGACPPNLVCFGGAENGGTDFSGSEGCSCQPRCGDVEAPQCNGACPTGQVCLSGAEAGGPEFGGPETNGCLCFD